jgi:hypothetical protein
MVPPLQLAAQMLSDELRHCSEDAKMRARRKVLSQLELRASRGERSSALSLAWAVPVAAFGQSLSTAPRHLFTTGAARTVIR